MKLLRVRPPIGYLKYGNSSLNTRKTDILAENKLLLNDVPLCLTLHIMMLNFEAVLAVGAEAVSRFSKLLLTCTNNFQHTIRNRRNTAPQVSRQIEYN